MTFDDPEMWDWRRQLPSSRNCIKHGLNSLQTVLW